MRPLRASKGYFAKLDGQSVKRGIFGSVDELVDAIEAHIDQTNADPKPFVWTARPSAILKRSRPRAPSIRVDPQAARMAQSARA